MELVLLTAVGVGMATVIGSVIGFIFEKASHRFSDIVLSFAAGVMLCAAVVGLIIPSLETQTGNWSLAVTVLGVICGAICVNLIDKLVPHLHNITGGKGEEKHPENAQRLNKVLLFVIAIAIHNLPEGIAAGVGFGTGDRAQALVIAGGIALQNIPEGMVIIAPMIAAGMSKGKTLAIAVGTGIIEIVGTLLGYFAVSISSAVLPFALAFAGGTMIYVISDEMIPETHAHGHQRGATYSLIIGFCLMLAFDFILG
ncbi:MAG: ZIP family metal transporter [Clostridia bacterium]|nr:ZIP family metal transporter [Clostridia bacterium]